MSPLCHCRLLILPGIFCVPLTSLHFTPAHSTFTSTSTSTSNGLATGHKRAWIDGWLQLHGACVFAIFKGTRSLASWEKGGVGAGLVAGAFKEGESSWLKLSNPLKRLSIGASISIPIPSLWIICQLFQTKCKLLWAPFALSLSLAQPVAFSFAHPSVECESYGGAYISPYFP